MWLSRNLGIPAPKPDSAAPTPLIARSTFTTFTSVNLVVADIAMPGIDEHLGQAPLASSASTSARNGSDARAPNWVVESAAAACPSVHASKKERPFTSPTAMPAPQQAQGLRIR